MVNRNRGIGIVGWIALIWWVGSLLGVFYSLSILFGGLCLWIWVLILTPHARRQETWIAASRKFDAWKERRGPAPSPEEMQLAANYLMLSDAWDLRLEDLRFCSTSRVPMELRPYFESERDLPRRWRRQV